MAFASEKRVDPERNPAIRIVRRFVRVTSELRGQRFVVREDGAICLTPLMVILLALESTDIVFAVDSVPTVFGVTKEPLIVYTSNVFAVLGLRAMYFLLAGALDRFHLLKYGLSVVLVFVGLKMAVLDDLARGRLPIGFSLAVIATTVIGAIALSLLFPRTPRAPKNGAPARVGRIVIGSVFTALCCANLVMAAGVRPSFLDLEAIRTEWLYVSGLSYTLCGWLLLRPIRHTFHLKNFSKLPQESAGLTVQTPAETVCVANMMRLAIQRPDSETEVDSQAAATSTSLRFNQTNPKKMTSCGGLPPRGNDHASDAPDRLH